MNEIKKLALRENVPYCLVVQEKLRKKKFPVSSRPDQSFKVCSSLYKNFCIKKWDVKS